MLSSGSGISSVAHQLSCFGLGFSLCLFTGGWFLCLTPFLWGRVSDLSAAPLLSVRCDGLLIIFQFFSVIWLWMLLTGSGYELCGPLPALFQAVAYHPPAFSPSAFPAFVYWKLAWRSAPCSSPILRCTFSNSTPLLYVSFQFLVYCSAFLCVGGSVCPGEGVMLVYPWACFGNTTWCLVLTCWSAKCLPSRFGAGIWQCRSPPVFLV
jgi:hypothetical protein